MIALAYLEQLLLGTEVSSIPIQRSELELLKKLMLQENLKG